LPRRGPAAGLAPARSDARWWLTWLGLVTGGALCTHMPRWLLRPVADLAALHACRN